MGQAIHLLQHSLTPPRFEPILGAVLERLQSCRQTSPFDQAAALLLAASTNYPELRPICVETLCSAVLVKSLGAYGAHCGRQLLT